MKSQRLTNILLVVIAVGTLGNFFQGQAVRHPSSADALGRLAVEVRNRGFVEAVPVKIMGFNIGYGPFEGLPTKPAMTLANWKAHSSATRVLAVSLYLRELNPYDDPLSQKQRIAGAELAFEQGMITSQERADVVERLRTERYLPSPLGPAWPESPE